MGIGPYNEWVRWYGFAKNGSRIGAKCWADRGVRPYGVRRRLLRSTFAEGKSSTSAASFFLSKR